MKDNEENKPKSNGKELQKVKKIKKEKKVKEKLGTRFINVIKKRWLISGTNTMLLIAILIAIVILINSIVQSLDLTAIDCTSNQQYTLTDESKERVANLEDSVNIYFVGYDDDDTVVSLAKQYNDVNENINVEVIDATERTDIADKYDVTNDYYAIIIENGDRSKILYSDDLYTYDSDYNTIDLSEEKLTSGILSVTTNEVANVYFLTGYSDYSLDYSGGLYYLSLYLEDEVLNYEELDTLVSSGIPDDCDLLVITTPTEDFDELTTESIINYINNGGNILWLNGAYASEYELTNVNKILALYGIDPFDVGFIYETDSEKMALGYASCIVEDLGNTEIDSDLSNVLLLNATRINVNEDLISELEIEEEDIITTDDTTYFRTDVSSTTSSQVDGDEQGSYVLGAIFTKTISDSIDDEEESDGDAENEDEDDEEDDENTITSELVIFGDNNFISDGQISSQVNPMIFLYDNKDLVLNSIAYLTEQESSITIRKNYSSISSFTATDAQKTVIMRIIFLVPIAIILFGIVIWQIRRRKK